MLHRLWELSELHFQPGQLQHYETLFTIGNGYLGARGAFEEGYEGDNPATLVHGVYDHAPNTLVPELVNAPNWLPIHIRIDGTPFKMIMSAEDILRPPQGVVLGYNRTLHLDRAVLRREVLFRAASGSVVRLVFERFASLADTHVMAQRVQIVAVDGNPTVEIESAIEGDVSNKGTRHWSPNPQVIADADGIGLEVTTEQSGYVLGVASRLVSPEATRSSAVGARHCFPFALQLARWPFG